ncbi:uncharacterized protein LOC105165294 [Sesamum indicum]|uniref:Uncharacterized protein LOC105165294 n=1 Tax=Sesamum indicum TaxID=4182 RepID=A0A6I9THW6_SESIN|nr:uncharacterized protein LOC105165294 [Sesamum indicum]
MLRVFILLTLFSVATIHARNLPDDEYMRKTSAGSTELKLFTGSRPTSVRENLCKWLIAITNSMLVKICDHHKNMGPVGRPSRPPPPPPRPPPGSRPVAYIQMHSPGTASEVIVINQILN